MSRITNGFSPVEHVFACLCKSIATPIAKAALLALKAKDHNGLLSMSVQPTHYTKAEDFHKDYLVVSFLSKYKGLDTGKDLKSEALSKFKLAELQCKHTNDRITGSNESDYHGLKFEASKLISKILGVYSESKFIDLCGWGPGSTYELPRRRAYVDLKLSELPITVTATAMPIFRDMLHRDLHWSAVLCNVNPEDISGPFCFMHDVFEIVPGAKVTTVAKNAKTDRVIAIEPRANGFLQKGIGSYIRKRLRRFGINLDDQGNNQRGAHKAFSYAYSTIDLSMASDTVAREVVFDLLPVEWSVALNNLRSKHMCVEGQWTHLEKFSSMGNGFTFELETLIFYALAKVCEQRTSRRQEQVLVYGDDIIVPRESAELLIRVLTDCGFVTNKDKTFIDGDFFESCGKHYFRGVDVTPIYQKEITNDNLEVIRMGNRFMRLAVHRCSGDNVRIAATKAYEAARRFDSGPETYLPHYAEGDDGWLRYDFPGKADRNKGYRCRVYRAISSVYPANPSALLAWSLRRGVVVDNPFMDDLPSASGGERVTLGWRNVEFKPEFAQGR